MRLTAWDRWRAEHLDQRDRVRGRPHWRAVRPWECERDDGVQSGHKAESPFMSWRETLERSMELYDRVLPMGRESEWPDIEGARLRSADVNFGAVWAWAQQEAACPGT